MPKLAYTLGWSAHSQTYVLSDRQKGEIHSIAPESPAWFAWLSGRSSFVFQGQVGSYTARLEAAQPGTNYWYAYRRHRQQLRKKYLGKTTDLTVARLEQVARLLCTNPAMDRPVALLSTRLHVPRLPVRLIHRDRLVERLRQGLKQKLLLLSAPAGFGKTTLLAEFLAAAGRPAAWLSLEAEDNDPPRFLSSLLGAFQSIDPSLGSSVQVLLSSPNSLQGLSLSSVFALLLNDLTNHEVGEFLLVLDDYHTITAEPLQQAIASLVEHCPPALHLVISTRADPRLSLARLRAQGQLCEIRAADLQFDATEASHFLRAALERDLEPATVAAILSRTEGWIAGLQLTALLLQRRTTEADVRQFLADPLGSHRHLVDYLVEEVFARQPEAVQSFLQRTSILERLSAPLCAAVTGGSTEESQALLDWLERENLFLVPLDEQRAWYRYHQLWASVLQTLLMRQLGATGVAALYAQASGWYEQHDMPSEAIETAIRAGAFERAVQLIEQRSPLMIARSQHYTLRRWLEHLPHDLWAARPIVCLAYAWTLFLGGAGDAYVAPLDEAERLFRGDGQSVGVGMVDVLRAFAALTRGEGRQALAHGQEALALVPQGDLLVRSVSTSVVGAAYWLTGELKTAWQRLQEARTLHERTGNVRALLLNTIQLGAVLDGQGKLHEAARCYQQVIDSVPEGHEYAIEATIRLAWLWYAWNDLETAEARLARVVATAPTPASWLLARGVLSLAYIIQARIRQIRGEQDAASALLAQAATLVEQQRHARLPALVHAAQVRWWLAQGKMEAVKRWRETWSGLQDTTPTYENELGALSRARVLLVQGEAEEALRQLAGFRTLARAQERLSSELEILVTSALAEYSLGRTGQAVQTLQEALTLAEPEGYMRPFVDEGVPMAALLRLVLSRWKGRHGARYVERLLAILEAEHPELERPHFSPAVALSGRERLILRLLAQGRSNPEIAAELVVSLNTIKTQVSSLYRKLDAHSREEALTEASRLRLL